MEKKLKEELNVQHVKATGVSGGGCINEGSAYETENGIIFVKRNSKPDARVMFDGELASLSAILATETVKVPKPIKVIDDGCGAALIMEYIQMSGLRSKAAELGKQLARLHLHNSQLKTDGRSCHKSDDDGSKLPYVDTFGFHIATCCGYIPQDNSWKSDWVEFYSQKLNQQLQLIESEYGNREAKELWSQLQLKLPRFFNGITITPSLLHGDLWSGNVAEGESGPVIFDPASFYGHSEYELAIAGMFGGFPQAFHAAYHELLPKQPGFDKRQSLYQLFHYLNHWNHFGGGYKGSSLSTMRKLLK